MVIAEVQQQPVSTAADLQPRIEKLKKDGKKAAVLLVVSPDGDPELSLRSACSRDYCRNWNGPAACTGHYFSADSS